MVVWTGPSHSLGPPPHWSLSKPKRDLRGQDTSNMWLSPEDLEPKICPSSPTPAHHMQANPLKPPTHNPCTLSTNQHTEIPTHTHTLTYTLTDSGVASVTPPSSHLPRVAHSHSPQIPRCSPGFLGQASTRSVWSSLLVSLGGILSLECLRHKRTWWSAHRV